MTLDEQLAHFDRYAEKAYARCLKEFKDRKPDIIAAARQRLIDGYDVYKAEGYGWEYERLRAARLEEYSDGINYRLMSMFQSWG